MKLDGVDFRIYDRESKGFFFSDEVVIGKDEECGEMHTWHNGKPLCPTDCELELELSQNGISFYENDIVYFQYQTKFRKEVTLGVIAFENNCFCCKVFSILYPLSAVKILRVVGHIHEDLDDLETELVDLIDENATEALIFELKHKIRFLRDTLVFLARNKEKK